ncbi:MAG TPA: ribose-phosphate diphosphokinase [Acidimicrobiales bacterium]|jgi:ribose-phosphate pyrophosphokinase|nr:ribose-phosphate diphosphokinase [Acidimicrobiales bacterium]MDP6240826.1 ribose-phosphate diphosphokinase [Acidimicrobiales bacterium]MDP7124501.1 ribose-phosphate diphosphokinase [Acidimicrobiales bacterium]MDP7352995.1 ribose-phosphate diphosphokinase [Acidimicrobiales bacterium]HJL77034.1 ribose-phosphate diphosphokinase [Acidimicrobiales bacterium]|tara:strand:- start:16538 stop:17518 length:981 start_codon:yes stop_codon:yes gene_type:complete
MELVTHKTLYLVAGRASRPLAEEISAELGETLGDPNLAEFANGEIHCRFAESIRGCDAFIIQSHGNSGEASINDSLMEQLIMVDAARRASAKRITAVCPHYAYARQDRKSSGREPITAKLVANMFAAAGASRLVSVDLHSGQIQGFFDGPVDHLTAMPVLVDRLRGLDGELVIVSPDAGRVKVAERYANQLEADLAIVHKRRSSTMFNTVEAKEVVGEVDGKVCVLVDDMIDTAGTICAAADQLTQRGASRVIAATTHGVFSGQALERLEASPIEKVIVTNTLPLPEGGDSDLVEVLSIAPLLARAINAVFEDTSVSEIFGGNNLA